MISFSNVTQRQVQLMLKTIFIFRIWIPNVCMRAKQKKTLVMVFKKRDTVAMSHIYNTRPTFLSIQISSMIVTVH